MVGLATSRRSPPLQPTRADDVAHGLTNQSTARISIDGELFAVIPAPDGIAANQEAPLRGEQTRFAVCGRTFVVVAEPTSPASSAFDDALPAVRLTGRELQIAVLVAKGHPVKRVADKIGITDWTVKEYLRRIYAKLGVRNQAAMVSRCADMIRCLDRESC